MAERAATIVPAIIAAHLLRGLIGIVLLSLRLDSAAGYDIDPSWSAVMS